MVRAIAAALGAALLPLAGCGLVGGWDQVSLTGTYEYGYSDQDRTLAVSVTKGCQDLRFVSLDVRESDSEVVVAPALETRTDDDVNCAAVITYLTEHVQLDAPLGSRRVVGADGTPLQRCAEVRPVGVSAESCPDPAG
ncbi:hypothetical protein EEW87_002535 [Janibacter melonis]|uniref:Uncharacterized protein n=1 Tax=Janibacter melonis TaxID=262209 RepID=A0A5P8FK69_9MICO|nr:hypothetical protein [Janibacter melonis]QFQ29444.2 hypothetical protein EEW87_002535 [Janibacter melonis]